MTNNIKLKFLKNSPIGEDLFEGKLQEKIADVVRTSLSKDVQLVKRYFIKNLF